jgi:acyl-coenzyme A thioesterase PaaI-like protein
VVFSSSAPICKGAFATSSAGRVEIVVYTHWYHSSFKCLIGYDLSGFFDVKKANPSQINSPEQRIIELWKQFGGTSVGRKIFSYLLSRNVPYSGNVRPQIVSLEKGYVRVKMRDRRQLRNHLHSIHAIALANLGELASGLAMLSSMPPSARAIVTRLEIDYLKKARGVLTAEGRASTPEVVTDTIEIPVHADISDEEGDVVARMIVHWRMGPRQ